MKDGAFCIRFLNILSKFPVDFVRILERWNLSSSLIKIFLSSTNILRNMCVTFSHIRAHLLLVVKWDNIALTLAETSCERFEQDEMS